MVDLIKGVNSQGNKGELSVGNGIKTASVSDGKGIGKDGQQQSRQDFDESEIFAAGSKKDRDSGDDIDEFSDKLRSGDLDRRNVEKIHREIDNKKQGSENHHGQADSLQMFFVELKCHVSSSDEINRTNGSPRKRELKQIPAIIAIILPEII